MFCMYVWLCTMYVAGAQGGKKILDPLELEWQPVVSGYIVLGIELGSSGRKTCALKHCILSPT